MIKPNMRKSFSLVFFSFPSTFRVSCNTVLPCLTLCYLSQADLSYIFLCSPFALFDFALSKSRRSFLHILVFPFIGRYYCWIFMADLPVVCSDKLKKEEDLSVKPSKKLEEFSVIEVIKDAMVDNGVPLKPVTPDTKRENGDFPLDLKSPLSFVSSSPKKLVCNDLNGFVDPGSPHTPKISVFDPFAPGPEELAMAPLCKKHLCKPWASVARRLDFNSAMESEEIGRFGSDADTFDEETLLESVYESLLEAIVSSQTAQISSLESDSDGFKTPTSSPPCLNGVAETCPGAPLKPTMKLRAIDKGLCRKLNFDLLD